MQSLGSLISRTGAGYRGAQASPSFFSWLNPLRWVMGRGCVWEKVGEEPGLTFSSEYWQEAMTRQNWKTQMSVKKPLSSSR